MKNISITNIWEEDDMIEFSVRVSNGETSCKLVFYGDDDIFLKFANELTNFPKNTNHSVKYETGNWENSGHYFLLEVFCTAPNGKSAMKVIAKSFYQIPNAFESQFYIESEPANFNAFGNILKSWNPRIDKNLEWQFY